MVRFPSPPPLTVGHSNAHVSNEREYPREERDGGPDDTVGVPGFFMIDFLAIVRDLKMK